uniref:cationic amino acid transporter 4 isoform X2 n=1 Tax=Myxine glutinosa TaxID=7769 RepID=UPI00358E9D72
MPPWHHLSRLWRNIHRQKSMNSGPATLNLRRCLSTVDLTLLSLGAMMGAGLYVLTGTVAKYTSGPAVSVSFAAAGAVAFMAALCFAEFGARFPHTGSAYVYTYVSAGEFWAFLIGWNIVLEYVVGGASVARAWSGYLDALTGFHIRNGTISTLGRWNVPYFGDFPDFLAAGFVVACTLFVACGARVSATINHLLAAVSLATAGFVVIFGFILAKPEYYGQSYGGFAPFGVSGVLSGTATCFYAYVGFDIIATSSWEANDPRRSVPIATGLSLCIVGSIYILVSAALTLVVPWSDLEPSAALADAFGKRGYHWASIIVSVGSLCAMSTAELSGVFALPRVLLAMAEDGLIFPFLGYVSERTGVPAIAALVSGLLTAMLAFCLSLEALVQFMSIGTLLAYTFVAASVLMLRYQPLQKSSSARDSDRHGTRNPTSTVHCLELRAGEIASIEEPVSYADTHELIALEKNPGNLRPCIAAIAPSWLVRYAGPRLVNAAVAGLVAMSTLLAALCLLLSWQRPEILAPCTVLVGLGFIACLGLIWAHEMQPGVDSFQVRLMRFLWFHSSLLSASCAMLLSCSSLGCIPGSALVCGCLWALSFILDMASGTATLGIKIT